MPLLVTVELYLCHVVMSVKVWYDVTYLNTAYSFVKYQEKWDNSANLQSLVTNYVFSWAYTARARLDYLLLVGHRTVGWISDMSEILFGQQQALTQWRQSHEPFLSHCTCSKWQTERLKNPRWQDTGTWQADSNCTTGSFSVAQR